MTTEEILHALRTVKPEVSARFKARELGLFGSMGRGGQADFRDVDVLVGFDEGKIRDTS